jgi:glutamate 5-kinase
MSADRSIFASARRVVVKVGSAVLAREGVLEPRNIDRLAADLAAVLDADARRRIVLVSSGAVASGFRALGLDRPPKRIVGKQAAAAVGQPRLMGEYARAFAGHPTPRAVAQVLLTAEDVDHRVRFLNARRTLEALLDAGVLPIINENDSVSFDEIKLGDNDHLSALVATLVSADALVILSSVPGVYDPSSPGAGGDRPVVPAIRSFAEAQKLIMPEKTGTGVGGMATKLRAACSAAALGIPTVVASGATPRVVQRLLAGEALGTMFPTPPRARAARQRWIGFSARPKGRLKVDDGARRAITGRGASLLPSGLVAVEGTFPVGALVDIAGPDGVPFARGLVSYDAGDLAKLRGRKTTEIASVLGVHYADEAVHRDDMVVLEPTLAPRKESRR